MTTDTGCVEVANTGSCCASFYEQDWVRLLAEDSFHPGGAELTRRTVAAMALAPGDRLLDLGCGTGTTALMLAQEAALAVTGVDLSDANVVRARERALEAANRNGRREIRFVQGDVQELPFEDDMFDGAVAECVFSLMHDKAAALGEIHRVLRRGGRVGLTDMAITGILPADLAAVVAPWTCLADALDPRGYQRLFAAAGFEVLDVADESQGLIRLMGDLKRKLLLLSAGALFAEGRTAPPVDVAEVKHWLNRFRDEIDTGTIRYVRFQLRA